MMSGVTEEMIRDIASTIAREVSPSPGRPTSPLPTTGVRLENYWVWVFDASTIRPKSLTSTEHFLVTMYPHERGLPAIIVATALPSGPT